MFDHKWAGLYVSMMPNTDRPRHRTYGFIIVSILSRFFICIENACG
jgi:hypothetical protein